MNSVFWRTRWDKARKPLAGFLRRWGPALAAMIVIFVGSSIPGDEFPVYEGAWDFIVKKSGHLAEYGLLSVLLLRGIAGQGPSSAGSDPSPPAPASRAHLAAFGLAVLYAVSDEFHQRFTPGRNSRPLDVFIDAAGSCLGLALYYAWRVIRQTRSQSPRARSTRPRA